jgi:RHS repeat-associated protein
MQTVHAKLYRYFKVRSNVSLSFAYEESGLDYAMARYYASTGGRFLTPDPGHVGANTFDPQSWNAYVYALNDPINLVDPTGMAAEEERCSDQGELEEQGLDCSYGATYWSCLYSPPTP